MAVSIREFTDADSDAIVALSLRAWAPVFASLADILGPSGIYHRLVPDWAVRQEQAVRAACAAAELRLWVAQSGPVLVGFVAARLEQEKKRGEVYMIAVDPEHQREGIATRLMATAVDWFTDSGMTLALVETGGDPGHAPARRAYERSGFTALPVVRYFKLLTPPTDR